VPSSDSGDDLVWVCGPCVRLGDHGLSPRQNGRWRLGDRPPIGRHRGLVTAWQVWRRPLDGVEPRTGGRREESWSRKSVQDDKWNFCLIHRSNLVRSRDRCTAQQIRIDPVTRLGLGRAGMAIERLYQSRDMPTADLAPLGNKWRISRLPDSRCSSSIHRMSARSAADTGRGR
jgi:hypothetical protein